MNMVTDIAATVGKNAMTKILLFAFLFLCFVYVANGVGHWISEKFTKEATKTELVKQNTEQKAVIEAQAGALEKKDETIEIAKDLTVSAIRSMEDSSKDNVASAGKSAQIKSNLDKADTINKAEEIKITALEKDEAVRKQKLIESDKRLMEAQNAEIQAAFELAMQRSHL